jgi:hypothetical protein
MGDEEDAGTYVLQSIETDPFLTIDLSSYLCFAAVPSAIPCFLKCYSRCSRDPQSGWV